MQIDVQNRPYLIYLSNVYTISSWPFYKSRFHRPNSTTSPPSSVASSTVNLKSYWSCSWAASPAFSKSASTPTAGGSQRRLETTRGFRWLRCWYSQAQLGAPVVCCSKAGANNKRQRFGTWHFFQVPGSQPKPSWLPLLLGGYFFHTVTRL